MKGREDDFQKPSQQSAVYEVVNEFFHSHSIDGYLLFIQSNITYCLCWHRDDK